MPRSIKNKLLIVILTTAIVPLAVLAAVTLAAMTQTRRFSLEGSNELGETAAKFSREALHSQIQGELLTAARDKAALVSEKLLAIQNQTKMTADFAERIYMNKSEYAPRPLRYLSEDAAGSAEPHILTAPGIEISDADIAYELGLMGNIQDMLRQITVTDSGVMGEYIGLENGLFLLVDKNSSPIKEYDARVRGWYIGAMSSGNVFWTDIFADARGRGASVTCALAVYDYSNGGKVFKGVAGSGATLGAVSDIIGGTKIGESGYAFLLNTKGEVVISPHSGETYADENGLLRGTNYANHEDAEVSALGKAMVGKESGLRKLTLDGKVVYVAFAPLSVTDWSIGVVLPADEVVAPAEKMENAILALRDATDSGIASSINAAIAVLVLVIILAVAFASAMSIFFSKRITNPITALSEGVGIIAGGNLDYTVGIKTGDEIESLAKSVNAMSAELKDYIANLTKVTAEKERIGAELDVATKIQASMLPHIFPAFPEREEFDLYATMTPAKEVGGDFYDFFLLDDNTLGVVMADVSGKGVPAALFMVIGKTLIKNNAHAGKSPKEVFETVNNILCEDNDAELFITAFMGVLDLTAGEFTYVNAGHNPPVLKRAGGDYEYMKVSPGIVLAADTDVVYHEFKTTLGKGDTFYLYTDGVTEAMNTEYQLYGEQRLLSALKNIDIDDANNICKHIKRDIDKFAHGAEQADDITMLALIFLGKDRDEKKM
jgi:sigma-B regulation protein RsbU (phosphoserine phosphatase)